MDVELQYWKDQYGLEVGEATNCPVPSEMHEGLSPLRAPLTSCQAGLSLLLAPLFLNLWAGLMKLVPLYPKMYPHRSGAFRALVQLEPWT